MNVNLDTDKKILYLLNGHVLRKEGATTVSTYMSIQYIFIKYVRT